jgi:hypothetical protein
MVVLAVMEHLRMHQMQLVEMELVEETMAAAAAVAVLLAV